MKVKQIERFSSGGFPREPRKLFTWEGFSTKEEAEKFIAQKVEDYLKSGAKIVMDGEVLKIYPLRTGGYHFWFIIEK